MIADGVAQGYIEAEVAAQRLKPRRPLRRGWEQQRTSHTSTDWARDLAIDMQQPGIRFEASSMEPSPDGPGVMSAVAFQARVAAERQAAVDRARASL